MALNGIDTSCEAASSVMPSGTGMSPAAGATISSAQAPKLPPVATRWPTCETLDALTERLDDTDGLGPGARGHLGLEAVAAAGRPEVVVVDRGEQHPHERLARTGLGVRHLLDREDLGRVAEPGLDECAHGTAFRCCSACFLRGRTSGTTTGRVRLCRGAAC